MTNSIDILPFQPGHAESVAALCRGEGWSSYADPGVAAKGCLAPGAITLVAVDTVSNVIAGFAMALSDGIAQAYLAQLIIHPDFRRQGLARRLVEEIHARTGVSRLDLLTDDAQAFYDTFEGEAKPGYRIYPSREKRS